MICCHFEYGTVGWWQYNCIFDLGKILDEKLRYSHCRTEGAWWGWNGWYFVMYFDCIDGEERMMIRWWFMNFMKMGLSNDGWTRIWPILSIWLQLNDEEWCHITIMIVMRWWLSWNDVVEILICVVRGDESSYFYVTIVLGTSVNYRWTTAYSQNLNELNIICSNGRRCSDNWMHCCVLFFAGDHAGNAHFVNTKAGCLRWAGVQFHLLMVSFHLVGSTYVAASRILQVYVACTIFTVDSA